MKQERLDRFMWDDPDEITIIDEPVEEEEKPKNLDRFDWKDKNEITWLDD